MATGKKIVRINLLFGIIRVDLDLLLKKIKINLSRFINIDVQFGKIIDFRYLMHRIFLSIDQQKKLVKFGHVSIPIFDIRHFQLMKMHIYYVMEVKMQNFRGEIFFPNVRQINVVVDIFN